MNKDYQNALDYLYSFVDYSLKHASELAKAEFNLDRMHKLMSLLGDPQNGYPIIHIAGSKGKGSTAAFIASALRAADYKVGLYTSPHLQDFTERIQINGASIPQDDFAALVEELKPAIDQVPYITTFELTTALGFMYYSLKKVDVAVIEVGLGGRLDATNIISPLVSVITSISKEHTAVLGDSLKQIAGEKAGIVKDDIPFVVSRQKDEVVPVFDLKAEEMDAPLTLVGRDVHYKIKKRTIDGQIFDLWFEPRGHAKAVKVRLSIPLLGDHQVENAVTAYAALTVARQRGLVFSAPHIKLGFAETEWPGRFEIFQEKNPTIILDAAHNPSSVHKLKLTLNEYFPEKPCVLIFGVSEDKQARKMLKILAPRVDTVILTRADHPRALTAEELLPHAERAGLKSEAIEPVEAAVARALEIAGNKKIILAAGSIFSTAAVRAVLQNK